MSKGLLLFVLLAVANGSRPALAHDRVSDHQHLTQVSVDRALQIAEALMPTKAGTRLEARAPSAALLGWIADSASLGRRPAIASLERRLTQAGYRGDDVIEIWEDDMLQVLNAYDAVALGVVGKDVGPLYAKLSRMKAGDRRVESVRQQILLAAVTADDAKAVQPHRAKIASLLKRARGSR